MYIILNRRVVLLLETCQKSYQNYLWNRCCVSKTGIFARVMICYDMGGPYIGQLFNEHHSRPIETQIQHLFVLIGQITNQWYLCFNRKHVREHEGDRD